MGLTNKQKLFRDRYLTHFNATKAAIEAGYSERTARSQGQRLLTNVDIQAEIEAALDEAAMSAKEALMRLAEQSRVNIGDFFTIEYEEVEIDGEKAQQVKAFDLDFEKVKQNGHLVKSLTWTKYGPKLELHDAQAALQLIAKHHGLFNNDAGSSDDKPFIVRVVYGERANGSSQEPSPKTD